MKYLSLKQNTDDLKDALINETFINGGGVVLLQDSDETVYDPSYESTGEYSLTIPDQYGIDDTSGNVVSKLESFAKVPFIYSRTDNYNYSMIDQKSYIARSWSYRLNGTEKFRIWYDESGQHDYIGISGLDYNKAYIFKNISFNF